MEPPQTYPTFPMPRQIGTLCLKFAPYPPSASTRATRFWDATSHLNSTTPVYHTSQVMERQLRMNIDDDGDDDEEEEEEDEMVEEGGHNVQ